MVFSRRSNNRYVKEFYTEAGVSYSRADLVEAVRAYREANNGNSPGRCSGVVKLGREHVTTWDRIIKVDIPSGLIMGIQRGTNWNQFLESEGWELREQLGRGKMAPAFDAVYAEQIVVDYFESRGQKFWPRSSSGAVLIHGVETNWSAVSTRFYRGTVKGAEQIKSLERFVDVVKNKGAVPDNQPI